MNILSVDIGGTKTRVAHLGIRSFSVTQLREMEFSSVQFPSLEDILDLFNKGLSFTFDAVGIGVAGPVRDRRCQTTNLSWTVDARALESRLSDVPVHLLNDLEATAWGIQALSPNDLHELQSGSENSSGNLAVVAAGTGLGQAGVYRAQDSWSPFATEGGHCDFAPETELEYALHGHLAGLYGHVSWERIVSGPGIGELYRFLCLREGLQPSVKTPAAISGEADSGACPICHEALNLFLRLYGREAGNHALKLMATGGVYIGGGIAPKLLHRLKQPQFLEGFLDKGRMRPLMETMPVRVILNDRAALYGAGLAAANYQQQR